MANTDFKQVHLFGVLVWCSVFFVLRINHLLTMIGGFWCNKGDSNIISKPFVDFPCINHINHT